MSKDNDKTCKDCKLLSPMYKNEDGKNTFFCTDKKVHIPENIVNRLINIDQKCNAFIEDSELINWD